MPRQLCAECSRPLVSCYCSQVREICNETPVLIIQHKREASHPFGTVRPLLRCLTNARYMVVDDKDEFMPQSWMQDFKPILVYPDRSEAAGEQHEINTHLTGPARPLYVFLDGTWKKTNRILLRSTYLQSLPRCVIEPNSKSRYRIRKASDNAYLSTLESVVEILSITEQEPEKYQPLLALMDTIIDKQLAVMEAKLCGKSFKKSPLQTESGAGSGK